MARRKHDEHLSLSDALKEFISENKLQKGLDKVEIQDCWKEVMGQGVWSYTDQVQLRDDTLIVRLNSSVLRQELSFGKAKIVKMLNQHLGRDIVKKLILG
ncbi:DUF721 domain-containing protein [Sediminicola luteus]|uniref:RNA-binding protein n=1 Tax=Sediminicola luteus TaxID=319238 RepID=A0A2A4GAS0_9FLAO|nr:DUF721 domain-containing protein [Sediminicola luteus]PCE64842.1 RNA-binding protein [Sediminicola luteus]